MNEAQNSLKTQKVAVGGMTCVNCEILVARRLKEIPGVERVRVAYARAHAEIDYRGELDMATLQRAVAEEGYFVKPWDEGAAVAR
jgi:copper chaperone CopZ